MNIEKYTERVRGFIQSAQSLAMREGHQQFSPLHMLKVLLDDSEGLAGGLIDRAGGNSRAILKATEDALAKLPRSSPDRQPGRFLLALARMNQGEWEAAGQIFEDLYASYPLLAPYHASRRLWIARSRDDDRWVPSPSR